MRGAHPEFLPDLEAVLKWLEAAQVLAPRERDFLWQRWGRSLDGTRVAPAIRRFREELRAGVLAWAAGDEVPPAVVADLNQLLKDHPKRSRLKRTDGALEAVTWFPLDQPADLLTPLVHAAADLFSSVGPDRVRQCDECEMIFLDISKKGARRWCSMQLCGNRIKVAAYAARARKRKPVRTPALHAMPLLGSRLLRALRASPRRWERPRPGCARSLRDAGERGRRNRRAI